MKLFIFLHCMMILSHILIADPTVKYCRHSISRRCAMVDIWFGQYDSKRLFPMECSKELQCPERFECTTGASCFKEVVYDKNGHELKLVDGEYK